MGHEIVLTLTLWQTHEALTFRETFKFWNDEGTWMILDESLDYSLWIEANRIHIYWDRDTSDEEWKDLLNLMDDDGNFPIRGQLTRVVVQQIS